MKIGVDLRGLNYGVLTGVNTYTIHYLYCLYKIKQDNPNLFITSIGVKPGVFAKLVREYPFLSTIFDTQISFGQYIGLPFLKNNNGVISALILIYMRLFSKIEWFGCSTFDVLFLPQPKPILIHQKTDIVTIFHDIYGVIDNSTMNVRQRIMEHVFVYRLLAERSYKLFANSLSTAQDLQQFLKINEDHIKIVYPALPIWDTIKKPQIKNNDIKQFSNNLPKKYILSVSGLEPRKNWINILLAFKECQNKDALLDYYVIFAGRVVDRDYYQKLLEIIETQHIDRVIFHLDVTDVQKNELYEKCDFVLYPSYYEGFGFPILEAFRHHKPVVTSKISSMPELAREGALYVNPLNYIEIAAAMQILARDRVFYQKLVDYTVNSTQIYSWDELQKALENIVLVDETA
jgi:glycosyltransferase involved in cell wall biosynthesis